MAEAVAAVKSTFQSSQVTLESHVGNAVIPIYGDPARLQQMLVNLLINAAKYTPAGGRVVLSLERLEDMIEVRIMDTGVGIRPDMPEKVFDLFIEADESLDRSEGGMGVGLTLVRTIVGIHGGSVEGMAKESDREVNLLFVYLLLRNFHPRIRQRRKVPKFSQRVDY